MPLATLTRNIYINQGNSYVLESDIDNNFHRSSSCVQKESYLMLSKTWEYFSH